MVRYGFEAQECAETGESLRIVFVNTQGLANKMDALEVFLSVENPAVLCLAEHWGRKEDVGLLNLRGYTQMSVFCRSHSIRGGVPVYIKNSWDPFSSLHGSKKLCRARI